MLCSPGRERGGIRVKRTLLAIVLTTAVYAAYYAASMHLLNHFYTPKWTARHVLLPAAFISVLPLLRRFERFAVTTTVGYALGVLIGELFGGFESDVPPQFLHHGWWIWGAVFALSIVVGIIIELRQCRASTP